MPIASFVFCSIGRKVQQWWNAGTNRGRTPNQTKVDVSIGTRTWMWCSLMHPTTHIVFLVHNRQLESFISNPCCPESNWRKTSLTQLLAALSRIGGKPQMSSATTQCMPLDIAWGGCKNCLSSLHKRVAKLPHTLCSAWQPCPGFLAIPRKQKWLLKGWRRSIPEHSFPILPLLQRWRSRFPLRVAVPRTWDQAVIATWNSLKKLLSSRNCCASKTW